MKAIILTVAVALADLVQGSAFDLARAVWPEASDGLPNENVRFAASFEADGRPLVLKATGATQYKIKLDGKTVGWGPARAPEGWARVSEIPLETAKGRHELVFEVSGYNVRSLYCNIPQPAYLQAELIDADGKVLAATGKNGAFKATPISARHRKTVRFSSQRGYVECWTLPEKNEAALALAERPAKRLAVRRAPEPNLSVIWPLKAVGEVSVRHDPDADAKQWEYVTETSADPSNGYPVAEQAWDACRKSQQFVALEEMRPVPDEVKFCLKAGTRLRFDGGIEKTGFVRMKVKAVKPGKLWLNWSELLVGGKVNAFKMRNADISVWEFTEPGEYEIETMEPYALRYLEATAESGAFELSNVSVRLLESPEVAAAKLPRTGDAELDEVFAAARNTLAQNTLDTFMDCPGRERAAWLCDSFFSAKGFFALTGSTKVEKDFLENWLLPESFGDLPEGMLPMTYPSSATSGSFIPNWAMWYVLQLEDYLKRSGDRAFVNAMKPRMEKLIRFFSQYRNADGLLEKLPSWVFIEWSAANCYVQDVNYPANMTWAGVLEAYGRMYGDAEATSEAAKVRKTIFEQSFNGRFFRDHAKRWADGTLTVMPECTETCQDYALFFRFGDKTTPGNWYRTILDRLGGARPYGSDILPEIGKSAPFIGDALRLLALSELGETEILRRDFKAFYLAQTRRTGTLWETEREIHSNCHGFAGVAADLISGLVDKANVCFAKGVALIEYEPTGERQEGRRTIESVAYSHASTNCVLDLSVPGEKGFPTLVWLHGGGLQAGHRHHLVGFDLNRYGSAAVEYRLVPEGTYTNCLEDAAAAVAWVIEHIKEFGGDPEKVFVGGHSAGGWLTYMVGMDPRWLNAHGCSPGMLSGLLPISGQATKHFNVRAFEHDKEPRFSPRIDEWAPLRYVRENLPPMLIVTGDPMQDICGRSEENALMAASLRGCENDMVEFYAIPETDHCSCEERVAPLAHAFVERVLRVQEKGRGRKSRHAAE